MPATFQQTRVPFAKMSYTPDVPPSALGPNEYNDGLNVEADVRGIRSVAGDQEILETVPDIPTFVTGGFRQDNRFWFVVACENGRWYANDGTGAGWTDISPLGAAIPGGYNQATNITEAWSGTVVFFNDAKTAPMFWPEATAANPNPILIQYSQQIPFDVSSGGIVAQTTTTKRVYISVPAGGTFVIPATPYSAGETIVLSGVNPRSYDGTWVVTNSTNAYVDITCAVTDAYGSGGQLSPEYSWNYNANWQSVFANFMRIYNTPNVGSILVAGNLTATEAVTGDIEIYPVSVQWSQNFGLLDAPRTWTPTVTNVANQVDVPLRGPALDAFPCNGQFFLCSYWDTVVFSPLNYQTTSTPILGIRLFNQGRGLLSSNCWANTDRMVYGIDARDVWAFDGNSFTGLGNQRVKNWLFDQLDPAYQDRVFLEVNTQKSQIEIYYPDASAVNGVPNKMLSYRYDLDCWNAPREVTNATFACESPIYKNATDSSLPQWEPALSSRTVVYARGQANQSLVQKDQGYSFADGAAISSYFVRDSLRIVPDYTTWAMIHRVLPEAVNLGANENYQDSALPDSDELPIIPSPGNITISVSGSNSMGEQPVVITSASVALNTTNPWIQVNQNSYRVNRLRLSNTSDSNIWMCNAVSFQWIPTEDDR